MRHALLESIDTQVWEDLMGMTMAVLYRIDYAVEDCGTKHRIDSSFKDDLTGGPTQVQEMYRCFTRKTRRQSGPRSEMEKKIDSTLMHAQLKPAFFKFQGRQTSKKTQGHVHQYFRQTRYALES